MNRNHSQWWWANSLSILLALTRLSAAQNAPLPQPLPATNVSLSASAGAKRARWQQHLTLGAGDVLNLSLFGQPETAQNGVPVGPDGRISFLQARDVKAAGLTVDQLRARLDQGLTNYYQNPHTVVVPLALHSKKYVILGAVAGGGVYDLDRPLTVIEAIARAGGLETGLYEQRPVELADLSRSFLVRNGQRLPLNFERLFQRGDLSQNAALEPDDYLYFASATANEIYVLGEVNGPGVVGFAPRPTAISVIASRGGFSPVAFKSRVLVVRGSLNHPQTFVVDTAAVLSGKTPDFKLQPKDIVYVSRNPWIVAAEVIDGAARSFVQALIAQATTLRMPAVIK